MSDLIDILKNDFKHVGRYAGAIGTGLGKGMIRGAYSPFLIGTGAKQFAKDLFKPNDGSMEAVDTICSGVTQFYVTIGSATIPALIIGWEYLAILGATNAADYLFSVHKRSKQKKEPKQKEE